MLEKKREGKRGKLERKGEEEKELPFGSAARALQGNTCTLCSCISHLPFILVSERCE